MATTKSGVYYRTNSEANATVEAQALSLANSIEKVSGLVPVVPTSVVVGNGSASVSTLGQVTFTGVGTYVALNGVFNSTYKHYRIILSTQEQVSGIMQVQMRLRSSGTDTAGTNYAWAGQLVYVTGSSVGYTANGVGQHMVGYHNSGSSGHSVIDIVNPWPTVNTHINASGTGYDGTTFYYSLNGVCTYTAVNFDGFSINFAYGTGGTVQVYAYNQ